eukprot:536961-Alexandrium_andersonii.AAC.1
MRRVFIRHPHCRRCSSRPATPTPMDLSILPSSASRAKGGGDGRRRTSGAQRATVSTPTNSTTD